ncbi:MAG TPA: ABC-2 family transporter protein, partial [Bacillota bacterium]|nr:ABC-2 family transporter protein [Bacillota bacterium]
MESILRHLKIWWMMVSKYIKAKTQYRLDFIIGMLTMVVESGTGLLVLWILFPPGSTLAGWNFRELFFIYSLTQLALIPMYMFFVHLWGVSDQVESGEFIKYYFRPINMFVYYIGDRIDIRMIGNIFLASAAVIYASSLNHIQWTLWKIVFLLFSLFGSSLILISVYLVAASVSLVFDSPLFVFVHFISRFIEFAKYPATIFKGFIRFMITCMIPMAFMGYYPALYFLRPQEGNLLMYASPVIGIVMFILAYQVWRIGV